MEIWKDIPGYENTYQASNMGRIRSCDRIIREYTLDGVLVDEKIRQGHILKSSLNKKGYPVVGLYTFGKVKVIAVHILVVRAFYGIQPDNIEIHHIDHDRTNNNIDNLLPLDAMVHQCIYHAHK